jgi:hypothetical protein
MGSDLDCRHHELATLKDGTRDGQLADVECELKTAHIADGIEPNLQPHWTTGTISRSRWRRCMRI